MNNLAYVRAEVVPIGKQYDGTGIVWWLVDESAEQISSFNASSRLTRGSLTLESCKENILTLEQNHSNKDLKLVWRKQTMKNNPSTDDNEIVNAVHTLWPTKINSDETNTHNYSLNYLVFANHKNHSEHNGVDPRNFLRMFENTHIQLSSIVPNFHRYNDVDMLHRIMDQLGLSKIKKNPSHWMNIHKAIVKKEATILNLPLNMIQRVLNPATKTLLQEKQAQNTKHNFQNLLNPKVNERPFGGHAHDILIDLDMSDRKGFGYYCFRLNNGKEGTYFFRMHESYLHNTLPNITILASYLDHHKPFLSVFMSKLKYNSGNDNNGENSQGFTDMQSQVTICSASYIAENIIMENNSKKLS